MILFGAGGHGRVIYESLRSSGVIVGAIFDEDESIQQFEGLTVNHTYDGRVLAAEKLIIAIGANDIRYKLSRRIEHQFGQCLDHTAHVSVSAVIGAGTVLMARAIAQTNAQIGHHVILNTASIIEHDCRIDDFAHVGPGSIICGGSHVGTGVLIGANATVLPGVSIGAWTKIGAGAVVRKNIESGVTYYGKKSNSE